MTTVPKTENDWPADAPKSDLWWLTDDERVIDLLATTASYYATGPCGVGRLPTTVKELTDYWYGPLNDAVHCNHDPKFEESVDADAVRGWMWECGSLARIEKRPDADALLAKALARLDAIREEDSRDPFPF
jgi:hypothetical protein